MTSTKHSWGDFLLCEIALVSFAYFVAASCERTHS